MQDESVELFETNLGEKVTHLLTEREQWAIRAAIAANRPLLVEGEPGVGKTQLASAAAKLLNRPLVSMTVDSRTESRDLLWTFDAVQRLAEAQVAAAVIHGLGKNCDGKAFDDNFKQLEEKLKPSKFVRPGPIWWAINWKTASEQLGHGESSPEIPKQGWQENDGVVVLIDEIDKADRDLPNGLLEAFGSRQFTPHGWSQPVKSVDNSKPSLMIVTTNRERALPGAFLRRCLKLDLSLPPVVGIQGEKLDESELKPFLAYLVARGKLHFPNATAKRLDDAAEKILEFRIDAIKGQETQKPGLAEFLDLVRAIESLGSEHDGDDVFKNVCDFFRKPPERLHGR
jgi:MoxR-like ATPase